MAIQAERVTTTIVVKGKDQASRNVRKAGKSVDRLRNQATQAQRKFSELGGGIRQAFTGDALGAMRSFSGALGGLAGPGGIAAGAALGIAGVGVAAAAAAVKLTRMLEEVERFRVQARAAFAGGEQAALAFANQVGGVTVNSVVEFRSQMRAAGVDGQFTAKQLQNLANTAARVGKTGDDALTALAQAIQNGNTRALKSVGVFINASRLQDEYARAVGKTTTQLTQQEKQQLVVDELQRRLAKDVAEATTVWARQDKALARLDNSFESIKLAFSDFASGGGVAIVEVLTDEAEGFEWAARAIGEFYGVIDENARSVPILTQRLEDGTISIEEYARASFRAAQGATQWSKALLGLQLVNEGKTADLVQFLERRGRTRTIEGFAGTVEPGGIEALRRAQRASRGSLTRRRRRTPTRTASARSRPRQEMGGGAADDEAGFGDGGVEWMLKQEAAAREQAAKLREADLEARRAATEARLEQERQLAEAQQRAIELERIRRMEAIDTASAITSAALNLGTSTGLLAKNDKLQRALLAGRSLADAAREAALAASAGAAGNIPKAIAHGAAAAAHGIAAARYRGGGKGGGGSARAATPAAGAVDSVARGDRGGAGGNVTINTGPGFLIATPAQLAQEIKRLQLAGAGTGL